jgi:hypothetical protein
MDTGTRAIFGPGVIWNGDPLDPPVIPAKALVIPAKAGIQSDDSTFPRVCGVDSRFRGNDQVSQMTPILEAASAWRLPLLDSEHPRTAQSYCEERSESGRSRNGYRACA